MPGDRFNFSFARPDLSSIKVLLKRCSLRTDDVANKNVQSFVGIYDNKKLIATGGLEVMEPHALLRSIATHIEYRGKGLANTVVRQLEAQALAAGISDLYLLTETAENYFHGLGYNIQSRNTAPAGIAETTQFSGLCPESATFMHKTLPCSATNGIKYSQKIGP